MKTRRDWVLTLRDVTDIVSSSTLGGLDMYGLILIRAESFGWSEKVDGTYVPLPFTIFASEAQVIADVFDRHPDADAVQVDRN